MEVATMPIGPLHHWCGAQLPRTGSLNSHEKPNKISRLEPDPYWLSRSPTFERSRAQHRSTPSWGTAEVVGYLVLRLIANTHRSRAVADCKGSRLFPLPPRGKEAEYGHSTALNNDQCVDVLSPRASRAEGGWLNLTPTIVGTTSMGA